MPENNDPLNQVAKRLLKEAGQSPDPYWVYLLQLVRWGLEIHEVRESLRWPMLNIADKLLTKSPAFVMRFLLHPDTDDPDEVMLSAEDLEGLSPEDAAAEVIELLHTAMSAKVRDYPVANPLP